MITTTGALLLALYTVAYRAQARGGYLFNGEALTGRCALLAAGGLLFAAGLSMGVV